MCGFTPISQIDTTGGASLSSPAETAARLLLLAKPPSLGLPKTPSLFPIGIGVGLYIVRRLLVLISVMVIPKIFMSTNSISLRSWKGAARFVPVALLDV